MRYTGFLRNLFNASSFVKDETERCLKVAVIGAPNVGKSMLTNQLVQAKVSAVSSKMDTTTQNVIAAITENNRQLIFLDSPGVIGIKHARSVIKSNSVQILHDPDRAVDSADYILAVQDATATGDYIHHRVLHLLHTHPQIASSLVINKIDLVQRRSDLLELVRILCCGIVGGKPIEVSKKRLGKLGYVKDDRKEREEVPLHPKDRIEKDEKWERKYRNLMRKKTHECPWQDTKEVFLNIRGWSNFDSVFFVSSLTAEGIEPLRQHLFDSAIKKKYCLKGDALTTKSPQAICADAIRAELLNEVVPDIAYLSKVKMTEWQLDGEVLQVVAEINCSKERHGRMIVGKNGNTIAKISKQVNVIMQDLLMQQLFVRILVKANGKLIDNIKK